MSAEEFRTKVQAYRRAAGITQKAIAHEMGLTPTVLSHKLNESDGLRLTHPEIKMMIKLLARWGAIAAQSEAVDLLAAMKLKFNAFSADEWAQPPLNALDADLPGGQGASPGSTPAALQPTPATPSSSAALPPMRPAEASPRHNLPAPLTSLIGRDKTVEEVRARFLEADVRLITLAGPGGVGKTRLAVEVGRRLVENFADGVAFVPLAGLSDPALVASEIVHVLSIRESDFDSPLDALLTTLRGQSRLLILDNFEHLTAAAPLISDLLAAAPDLKILVTSRAVLRLYGEHLYWVLPLALPDASASTTQTLAESPAVVLFVARARAARPDFALTDANAHAVADICERLDGMPLALELAAARSRLFSPAAILERLDEGLPFLSGRTADLPERQRRLEDTIRWSFDLLDEDEQRLFACVSIFPGGFTVESTEAVADDAHAPDVLDLLASLLDKSLISQREDATGQVRFFMLATLREFAQARLRNDDPVFARMAGYFLNLAERTAPELSGARQRECLELLDAVHDNLRAALTWLLAHSPGDALRMAGALWFFWFKRGYMTEGRRWLDAALDAAPDDPAWQAARATALYGGGALAYHQGEYATSRGLLNAALSIRRALADRAGEASTLSMLGNLSWDESALDDAQAHYEEAIAIAEELGDQKLAASALNNLGSLLWQRDQLDDAERYLTECLALHRQTGNKSGISMALTNLGIIAVKLGQFERANVLYAESVALQRELGDRQYLGGTLNNMGEVALHQGDYVRARALYGEALALRRQIGHRWGIASVLINLGSAETLIGSYGQGAVYLNEGLAIVQDIGDQAKIALAYEWLGIVSLRLGDTTSALAHHRKVLAISQDTDDRHGVALSLCCIAAVLAARGEIERAAMLWGYAESREQNSAIPLLPAERARYAADLEAARLRDPAAFTAGYAAGAALDEESALRLLEA